MSEHDCTTAQANELTAEKLRELLHYDPETGIFTRKVSTSRRVKATSVAGSQSGGGYLEIKLQNRRYQAHRLAWLHVYGEWPTDQIDHINRNRSDNRISNLREVSHMQNMQNRSKPSNNTSGHTGIYWHKRASKWGACIMHNYKQTHLGSFATIEEAVAARKAAEKLYWADTWIADTATV